MPHLFSGLNQKRQSGKITNGTFVINNTKGRGSTTRMYNYCTQNSENPSNCINAFIYQEPPILNNSSLFNTSSFNLLFDIYNSGSLPIINPPGPQYIPLPAPLIEALNVGANRWGKFLDFTSEMKTLISSFSNQIGYSGSLSKWNGLTLVNCQFIDYPVGDTTLAECSPYYIDGLQTSMNYGFYLEVKKSLFNNDGSLTISQSYLNTIITHELGHALGFPVNISSVNGQGQELLPNIYNEALTDYETNPPAYGLSYFPKAVATFNNMKGFVVNGVSTTNNYIPLTNEYENPGSHLRSNTIYKLQDGGSGININVFYRGFDNEIMIPYIEEVKNLFISQLSIDVLRDIYTSWQGKNVYNYSYKGGNETSKTDYQEGTELIVFS